MNVSPNAVSAKIYQFPIRNRVASTLHEGGAQVVPMRQAPSAVTYCVEVSYHEAAIAEDRARKV